VVEIPFAEISPALRALLPADAPGGLRLSGVVRGLLPGKILTDDPKRPTWAVVQESAFGTLYLGGALDKSLLARLVEDFRKTGEVLYGFWDGNDPYQDLFPETEYDGRVLEFAHRRGDLTGYSVPEGCIIRPFDRALFERSEDYAANIAFYGGLEKALEKYRGYCLMRGDEILSEASASVPIDGVIEIGTNTREAHRHRGYATIVCAHLIRECEQQGYKTYWNCAKQNVASGTLARKLGYYREKEYRLFAWFPAK
jgi:GNAT acetyltransferase-like protein